MNVQRLTFSALLAASSLVVATTAHADLRVNFYEGAPKDRFQIENTSACTISRSSVVIDLSKSRGGLIFDVSATGQGVEVYQPFEVVKGENALAGIPTVLDGQNKVELQIARLAPNEAISFTIDVDDTINQREITVTGDEFTGSTALFSSGVTSVSATFLTGPETTIPLANCS